jgi:hypothetical protein
LTYLVIAFYPKNNINIIVTTLKPFKNDILNKCMLNLSYTLISTVWLKLLRHLGLCFFVQSDICTWKSNCLFRGIYGNYFSKQLHFSSYSLDCKNKSFPLKRKSLALITLLCKHAINGNARSESWEWETYFSQS